jgi:hypothetical protein
MLRQFVRGYGILIACSVAILISLLFYQEYKQDVLAYSLELVGDKLVEMSPKDEDKATISAIYDAFKERVLAKEVPPSQVGHIAANILNLDHNGATLTPEQAAAMLEPSLLTLAVYESPGEPTRISVDTDRWVVLGERIINVCEFDKKIQEVAKAANLEGHRLKDQVHYECKDGLRVAVDIKLEHLLTEQLPDDIHLLEKEALVVWHERMTESIEDIRQQVEKDIAMITDERIINEQDLKIPLEKLRVLKTLSKFNYHFDEQRLQAIARRIQKKTARHWKDVEHTQDESSS